MTVRWANSGDTGRDVLDRVQRGLTVDMIMTPRAELQTCRRDETASDVADRNTKNFSFLPIVDGEERILGLYEAARWFCERAPQEAIDDNFVPFSEGIVIGADASIVDFVKRADEQPTRLVVSGDRVAGLVSLSDLQQLPVRAALFTLVTRLEMTMAARIEKEWNADSGTGWLAVLSIDRRAAIQEAIDRAKMEDGFVSEIALSQLADKATIIRKRRLIPGSATGLKRDFNSIVRLRNDIAHANYYAETPKMAGKVCSAVRTILRIEEELSAAISIR
ncbi:MAG: CBS domain-containing protein [Rhodospirillaceae bacterium]|nr:CBS domain-containing protein [Rhodospirillaceae bacterium]MDE0256744.1 CBS domain-containing protein [Rhodospirillaceae bacterium]MDE0617977.1 CBS domain-containing protein [Rhodospirillaceae bacterium]